jgi:Homeodomain
MLHSLPTHTPSPNTPYPAHMGYQNPSYLLDPSLDSAAVDFRAFYPYTPNEVKHRKRTTSAQLKVLETIFKKDTKPNANLRNELASELDMSARGVQVGPCLSFVGLSSYPLWFQVWFQNR